MIEQYKIETFDNKKTKYFSSLALGVKDALRLHKNEGELWEKNNGQREWGNVSEHCLVEVARIGVLADKLQLPKEIKKNLIMAAAVHDFNKKHEILAIKKSIKEGSSFLEATDVINQEGVDILINVGFDKQVIDISEAAGAYPETLIQIRTILDKNELFDEDIALLSMFYVDGYTQNNEWVNKFNSDDGKNDVDRRAEKNLQNKNYQKAESEEIEKLKGDPLLDGMRGAEALVLLCHKIEKIFVDRIKKNTSENIDSVCLPEVIDNEIRKQIEQV